MRLQGPQRRAAIIAAGIPPVAGYWLALGLGYDAPVVTRWAFLALLVIPTALVAFRQTFTAVLDFRFNHLLLPRATSVFHRTPFLPTAGRGPYFTYQPMPEFMSYDLPFTREGGWGYGGGEQVVRAQVLVADRGGGDHHQVADPGGDVAGGADHQALGGGAPGGGHYLGPGGAQFVVMFRHSRHPTLPGRPGGQ